MIWATGSVLVTLDSIVWPTSTPFSTRERHVTVATPATPARCTRVWPMSIVGSATSSVSNGIGSCVCFVSAPTRTTFTGVPSVRMLAGGGTDVSSPSSTTCDAARSSATVSDAESYGSFWPSTSSWPDLRVRNTTYAPRLSVGGACRTATSLPTRNWCARPLAVRAVVFRRVTWPSKSTVTRNGVVPTAAGALGSPTSFTAPNAVATASSRNAQVRGRRAARAARCPRLGGGPSTRVVGARSTRGTREAGSGSGSQVLESWGSARAGDGATAASGAAAASATTASASATTAAVTSG